MAYGCVLHKMAFIHCVLQSRIVCCISSCTECCSLLQRVLLFPIQVRTDTWPLCTSCCSGCYRPVLQRVLPAQTLPGGFSTPSPIFCLICTITPNQTGQMDLDKNSPDQVLTRRWVRHPLVSKRVLVRWCVLQCVLRFATAVWNTKFATTHGLH